MSIWRKAQHSAIYLDLANKKTKTKSSHNDAAKMNTLKSASLAEQSALEKGIGIGIGSDDMLIKFLEGFFMF